MAGNISDDRNELQEDDEKFQTVLHEFGSEFGYGIEISDDEEEVDEDDHLLIDLDYENEISESDHNDVVRSFSKSDSGTTSFVGSGSQSRSCTAADEESGEQVPRPSLALPSSQVDVAEYRADPLKTLHLNRVLQGILEEHINDIKAALAENKEKLSKLEEDASESTVKTKKEKDKKSMYAGVFRAPFFRHGHSYPPANEDMMQKKVSGDYDIVTPDSMKDLRHFNKTAKLLLREAVMEDCLEQTLRPIVAKMENEIEKRDNLIDEYETMSSKLGAEINNLNVLQKTADADNDNEELIDEVKNTIQELKKNLEEKSKSIRAHKEEIARLEDVIKEKRNMPEDQLLSTVDSEKVDWMKIAKSHFSGHSTWLDCQKAWENLVSPALNTRAWTNEEEKKLLSLIKSSATNNWKQIAKSLGTARTAFQCFSHYQQKFNSDLKPRPWTKAEDATLVRVTNNVKDSVGFFNWSKVSTLMDSRSPIECMYRYTKVDPSQSRGRFTALEDAKLLAAVEMIGPSWSKVAKFIGSRNMVQCRDRYMNCLAPNINFSHFTYDEDVKLLKLRKKFGQTWAKMVPEFVGRTDSMLLNRYRQLQRWKHQSEWFERQTEATKRMLLGKSLTVAERRQFQMKAEDYMTVQLGVRSEDYKRQELDRQNNVDPDIIPPRPSRHLRCYSFGNARKGGNFNKWSQKLDVHRRLTESLHRLLSKEILANAAENNGNGPPTVSEEVTKEIVQKSVEETLKGNKKFKPKINTKHQVRKLEAALNKAFLTTGTVSVQELLKSSELEKKRNKNLEKSNMIDSELKAILRRRGRTLSRLGRTRRFFEKDTRPRKVIEEEMDECDRLVPLMIMKYLGTDVKSLRNSSRHQCLNYQEELANQPSYEDDPDFQKEEAETQKAIQNLEARVDAAESSKQLRILRKKLKSLRKIHQEKIYLFGKVVENKIGTFDDDLEYFETLIDKKEEEINKNVSIMICNPPGISETAFDAELMEACSQTQASYSAGTKPTSNIQITLSNTSLTPSPPHQTAAVSKSDHDFAVPLVPPIKQRKRQSSRLLSGKFADEPAKKVFKILSKEEIMFERQQLSSSKKEISTNLPFLPPNLSTLLGLRALFLMKDDLKDKTQRLHRLEDDSTTHTPDITVSHEMYNSEDPPATGGDDESHPTDTASWFLYTTLDQLREQASSFKPYGRLGQMQKKSKHHFQTVGENMLHSNTENNDPAAFEAGALMFPLEERGGHLPNFTNKSAQDCDDDAKPVVWKPRKSSAKRSKPKETSHYEVVMGFTGCTSSECVSGKNLKKPTSTKCKARSISPPLMQNNFSLIPVTVIKPDPGATTVSYNICSEDQSDSGRLTSSAGSNWGVSVQNSTITRPDAVYSMHALDRSENNIAAAEDEDDVVAVIHLEDDDSNLTPTVINICSNLIDNVKTEIVESKDEESVIFTDNGRPSQFMTIPPEPEIAEASELRSLELPDTCVNSILRNKRLKNNKSRIVLVGVDEESKTIIHFKSEDNKFTAFEAKPTAVVEDCVGRHRGVQPFESGERKVPSIPECMRALRKTDEYKLLLARFRAMFMWPVFMSTVKPSPLNDGSLPTRLRSANRVSVQEPVVAKRIRKRTRGRLSAAQREHLKAINASSMEARGKTVSKAKPGEPVSGSENMDVDAGVSAEHQAAVPAPDTGVGSEQQEVSTLQAENTVQGDISTVASAADGENPSANNDKSDPGNEDVKEPKRRQRRGRPKGCRNHKYDLILRKRSQRIQKQTLEDAPPAEPPKEVAKVLPQWWKDAVLAFMLAKKAISDGEEEDEEIRIDEDDEFLDKGNYSDDEWYQQLRAEELKKAEEARQRELDAVSDALTAASSDAVTAASSDVLTAASSDAVTAASSDALTEASQETIAEDCVLLE